MNPHSFWWNTLLTILNHHFQSLYLAPTPPQITRATQTLQILRYFSIIDNRDIISIISGWSMVNLTYLLPKHNRKQLQVIHQVVRAFVSDQSVAPVEHYIYILKYQYNIHMWVYVIDIPRIIPFLCHFCSGWNLHRESKCPKIHPLIVVFTTSRLRGNGYPLVMSTVCYWRWPFWVGFTSGDVP